MQRLLTDMELPSEAVMAVGDGGNDYELVCNCGLGIAMANAVPKVRTLLGLSRSSGQLLSLSYTRKTTREAKACGCGRRCWSVPTT